MPTYEVEHNGKTYEVDAPDLTAAASAFGQADTAPPPPPPSPAPQGAAQSIQSNPIASGLETLALGMAKPALGLNSLIDHAVGGMGQFIAGGNVRPNPVSDWFGNLATSGDKLTSMLQRDAQGFQQASGQGPIKTGVLDLAGQIASPVNAAVPAATSLLDAAGTGAAFGAMQPTGSGGTPAQSLANTAMGAGGGMLAYGVSKAPELASNLISRVLPKGNPNPEVAKLAGQMGDLGVPIRPGQTSGSPTVKVFDDQLSRMPGTGYSSNSLLQISPDAQHEAFTRAVSKTFGEDAPALTQDVMAKAQDRIGGVMNDVLTRNKVAATSELSQTLMDINAKALDAMDEDAKPITNTITKIWNQLTNGDGEITGKQYLQWRQRDGRLGNLTENQNPTIASYGRQIKAALDDAFQSQAPAEDGQMLAAARAQYRNLKTIEPLAAKAPTGRISPALLLGEVRNEFPNMATKGAGDIGTLAKGAAAFLKEPPNSTTAERGLLMKLLSNPLRAGAETAALPLSMTVGRTLNSAINAPTIGHAPVGALPTMLGRLPPAVLGQMLLLQNETGGPVNR